MRYFCLFLFCFCFIQSQFTQDIWGFGKDFKRIDLPFEFKNNLIIVDVTLNKLFPLKFILDTGAENTILAKREITDLLNVPYEREFKLLGSDMKTELTAYLVRNVHFKSHDLIVSALSMLVLEEDYFHFEEMAGVEVHGILGADIFRGLVLKIDYRKRVISLTKRQYFNEPKGFTKIPIEIARSKPYLQTNLNIQQDTSIRVKLLLDSGAMVTFIVNTNTHPDLHLPPHILQGKVGAGLGGFLDGYLGRVASLDIGPYKLHGPITHFQDISTAIDTSLLNGRNGIIGNKLLSRFTVIIDYPKEILYLKTNKKFKKSFDYDKSGLVIIAADAKLTSFIVHDVIAGSPAAKAGILSEDNITHLNGIPVSLMSLESITNKLRKKEGKKIKLRVKRDKEIFTFKFRLKKLI
ncbi:MAG: aspartyl protease family protein [Saprospiraceae bacterium]